MSVPFDLSLPPDPRDDMFGENCGSSDDGYDGDDDYVSDDTNAVIHGGGGGKAAPLLHQGSVDISSTPTRNVSAHLPGVTKTVLPPDGTTIVTTGTMPTVMSTASLSQSIGAAASSRAPESRAARVVSCDNGISHLPSPSATLLPTSGSITTLTGSVATARSSRTDYGLADGSVAAQALFGGNGAGRLSDSSTSLLPQSGNTLSHQMQHVATTLPFTEHDAVLSDMTSASTLLTLTLLSTYEGTVPTAILPPFAVSSTSPLPPLAVSSTSSLPQIGAVATRANRKRSRDANISVSTSACPKHRLLSSGIGTSDALASQSHGATQSSPGSCGISDGTTTSLPQIEAGSARTYRKRSRDPNVSVSTPAPAKRRSPWSDIGTSGALMLQSHGASQSHGRCGTFGGTTTRLPQIEPVTSCASRNRSQDTHVGASAALDPKQRSSHGKSRAVGAYNLTFFVFWVFGHHRESIDVIHYSILSLVPIQI